MSNMRTLQIGEKVIRVFNMNEKAMELHISARQLRRRIKNGKFDTSKIVVLPDSRKKWYLPEVYI